MNDAGVKTVYYSRHTKKWIVVFEDGSLRKIGKHGRDFVENIVDNQKRYE